MHSTWQVSRTTRPFRATAFWSVSLITCFAIQALGCVGVQVSSRRADEYIKRLVGLPGEYLHIEGGDVYTRLDPSEPWQLARKPADKVLAMMQVVSDTNHQPRDLVARGWPSLWQGQPLASDANA